MKVCNVPGCPEWATYRGRCPEHRPESRRSPSSRITGTRRFRERVRPAVLERDGYRCTHEDPWGRRCVYAESSAQALARGSRLQADHVRAVSKGGDPWDLENLRTLCRSHNLRKGDR